MPIRDRKFYIQQHNRAIEAEKNEMERNKGSNVVDGLFIDKFTDMAQGFDKALNKPSEI